MIDSENIVHCQLCEQCNLYNIVKNTVVSTPLCNVEFYRARNNK